MGTLAGLLARGMGEEGYVEKASPADLDSKTANKGSGNYTKYSRDINALGLMGCQGQPWCCTFQFWLDAAEYGALKALKLWHMAPESYVGYNCFATYNRFASSGQVGKTPKLGAVVIFTFSHAGRVVNIYEKDGISYFDCLEGNTSSNLSDRNGGQVKIKPRRADDSTIKGFCYIDYGVDEDKPSTGKKSGWYKENGEWKFYLGNTGKCVVNDWYLDNGRYAWFDGNGNAIHDTWLKYKGQWYAFGSDCYMLSGQWYDYKGKFYYLSEDGSMAVNAYIKSKDINSRLYYWVNADGEYEPEWDTEKPDLKKYRVVE